MKIGLFTAVFGTLPLEAMLAKVAELGIEQLELGTGGWPGDVDIAVDELLASRDRSCEFLGRLSDHGCSISALSCRGNPLHPTRQRLHSMTRRFAGPCCSQSDWVCLRW